MSKGKHVKVIKESDTGRNELFIDMKTKKEMTRPQFVKAIESDQYPSYHTRTIKEKKTPVSNPDKSEDNNLG